MGREADFVICHVMYLLALRDIPRTRPRREEEKREKLAEDFIEFIFEINSLQK